MSITVVMIPAVTTMTVLMTIHVSTVVVVTLRDQQWIGTMPIRNSVGLTAIRGKRRCRRSKERNKKDSSTRVLDHLVELQRIEVS